MDAKSLMNGITEKASAVGMTFSDYIKTNYDPQDLDNTQAVVDIDLSDNKGKNDKLRQNNNIKRSNMGFSGMDTHFQDPMHTNANAKLEHIKADYTAMHVGQPMSREAVLV